MKSSSSVDMLQPSSRDASGEDAGDDSATATVTSSAKHKKGGASIDGLNPPAKRPRTRSTNAHDASTTNGGTSSSAGAGAIPSIHKEDPGEPSDTTEASMDIANRSKLRRGPSKPTDDTSRSAPSKASDGSNGKSMAPPVKAGLTDPVGYHTNPPPQGRPVRVYADGVFDLFHLGHMRQLEQAKHAFPDTYLIVGVTGDAETHKRKGLTVLSGAERAETVRHCKWVDEVIPNCPWIVTPEFLNEHHIDYVAHDDIPYGADEGDDIYKSIKERGQFLVTQRTEGVSTTGIITKIVRDYEQYIARQLKRGTSRQELNVSWLKKNELELKRHVQDLRSSLVNNFSVAGNDLARDLWGFWERSRPASPARRSLGESADASAKSSQASLAHLSHLDIPKQGASNDFAAGYSLGLIGGIRSWMTRSRRSLHEPRDGSPRSAQSSDGDESDGVQSPPRDKAPARGRKEQRGSADVTA